MVAICTAISCSLLAVLCATEGRFSGILVVGSGTQTHLQKGPEKYDNPNGAHLHQLLLRLLACQLLGHAGPPLPCSHQVTGLQAGLGR